MALGGQGAGPGLGMPGGPVQAQDHVQVGNIALSVQVVLDWLDSIGRRDGQPALTS
jgi:hypothetical protein